MFAILSVLLAGKAKLFLQISHEPVNIQSHCLKKMTIYWSMNCPDILYRGIPFMQVILLKHKKNSTSSSFPEAILNNMTFFCCIYNYICLYIYIYVYIYMRVYFLIIVTFFCRFASILEKYSWHNKGRKIHMNFSWCIFISRFCIYNIW